LNFSICVLGISPVLLISVAKLAKYFYFREESCPFLVENFLFGTIFPAEKALFSLFGLHFHFRRVLFLEK